MSEADSSYNALQIDFNRRFSQGLSLRGVYTWSKVLDDGDSLNATAAGNDVALLSNPYDPHADWGLGTFDVRNVGVISATYDLPFGQGKHWLGGTKGATGQTVGRLDGQQHRDAARRFPFHSATELQPFQRRGYAGIRSDHSSTPTSMQLPTGRPCREL